MSDLRESDIALTQNMMPTVQPCRRESWLLTGKLFTIAISQEFSSEKEGVDRLFELAAAANEIVEGAESFRDMNIVPFIPDHEVSPRAILGFARSKDNLDIRVNLFPPRQGVQIRSSNG